MKKIFFAVILALLLSVEALAQGVVVGDYPLSKSWSMDVNTVQVSFFQVGESEDPLATAAVTPLVAVGGALSFSYGNPNQTEYKRVVTFNIPTIFLKTATDENGDLQYSFMPAITLGLLDNQACFGVAYDTGPTPVSRWVFLFALGLNI